MRFLRRLWRHTQAALPPLLPWPEGPDPVQVTLHADGANPVHRLLEDLRLPWHEARAQVKERVGVRSDPIYGGESLVLPEAVPLPGAMAPWTARADASIPPQFPISRFSALVWFEDDAHANLRRTADHLAAWLGPASIGQQWNTLTATWRSGLAEIRLVAWPPEWQSHDLRNDAQEREPRLRTACHVNVATGFILPLTERERQWVAGFRPIAFEGSVGTAHMSRAGASAPFETELEHVRDPSGLALEQASLGLSADGEALIVVSNQLFIVPRERVMRLEVIRLTPAKGGGGSSLRACCRTAAPGANSQSVFLAQASDPDGMNGLGTDLAKRLGCPVEIGPYFPDA